jgi:hypothetical protein
LTLPAWAGLLSWRWYAHNLQESPFTNCLMKSSYDHHHHRSALKPEGSFFVNWWNLSKSKTKNENLKIFSRFSFSRFPGTEVRK